VICRPALFGAAPGAGDAGGFIASGTPQAWQNFAAAGFSTLQAAHFIESPCVAPMMPRPIRQSKMREPLREGESVRKVAIACLLAVLWQPALAQQPNCPPNNLIPTCPNNVIELRKQQEAQRQAQIRAQQEAQRQAQIRAQQEAQRQAQIRAQQEAAQKAALQKAQQDAAQTARGGCMKT